MPEVLWVAIGLLGGAVLGWLAAQLALHSRSQREIADLKAKAQAAEQLVVELRQQVQRKDGEVAELRRMLEEQQQAATEARTRLDAARQAAEDQRRLLDEAGQRLSDAFKALSVDALQANNQAFLQLAKQSLEAVLTEARGDIGKQQEAISDLIRPLQDTLKRYEEQIQELESKRGQDYGGLAERLRELTSIQEQLRRETGSLVAALRNPRVRGRWGEVTLRRVVELAGMAPHCDFTEQETVSAENGQRRPDLVVHLPAGRQIVVDAKVPLEAYLDALGAPSEEAQRAAMERHAQQVRNHIGHLASRAYWAQFTNTPEFVVMFVPGDTFLAAALEADASLIEDGMARNVIIATPATLIALLRAVDRGWRQEQIAEEARQISDLGRQLYERLRTLAEHLTSVGNSLGKAVDAYNKAVGSLESRVLPAARRFRELGAAAGEEIPLLEPVDRAPRVLTASIQEEPEEMTRGEPPCQG
jgi:DNA recombination protein RmuC